MFVVGDRMAQKVVTVKPADTLAAAAAKMKMGKFRRLPVVEANKLVGIVSEFDLKRHAGALESTLVETAMTRDPITVMPSETLQHAADLMRQHNVGALPVIYRGKLAGIVTAKISCCLSLDHSLNGIFAPTLKLPSVGDGRDGAQPRSRTNT